MGGLARSILGIVVVAAIVGLITLARGEPDHPRHDPSGPAAAELRLSL
jgi:hypothetical protein